MSIPESIKKQKPTLFGAVEIRCFGEGKYYVYLISSKWNPDKNRPQKVTGKSIGKITESDGFIPNANGLRLMKEMRVTPDTAPVVKNYGAYELLQQLTPNSSPTAAQVPYNTLLALYLGAQSQGNSACYVDADGAPTVVLHGSQAYRVVSPANDYSLYNWLGGTGGSEENPWQTGTAFTLKSYEDNGSYIYYTSSGADYQVIGYYNCKTCDNVWARLHYYQVGVGWQAEYHIVYCNRPDSANGSETEVLNGTCDAQAMYEADEAVEQLKKELQNRGMSAGSWGDYKLMEANQQSDALWEKAGSHNTGFAPQSGETYGVAADSASVYSAANTTSAVAATLPAGTLLSIAKSALPIGSEMVPVQAKINGTWVSGYMQPEHVLAWIAH